MIQNIGTQGTHYKSHSTETLNIWPFYNYIVNKNEEDYDKIVLPSVKNKKLILKKDFFFYDYQYRSIELENCSLYNFFKFYSIKKKITKNNESI